MEKDPNPNISIDQISFSEKCFLNKYTELPERPDSLIRIGLSTLEDIENRCSQVYPKILYRKMGTRCILSTVILYDILEIKGNPKKHEIRQATKFRLNALSSFTKGDLEKGLSYLRIQGTSTCPKTHPVPSYFRDADFFKKEMRIVACILQNNVFGISPIDQK